MNTRSARLKIQMRDDGITYISAWACVSACQAQFIPNTTVCFCYCFFSLSIIRFYPLQLVIAILFPKHSILQCEANILQKQCCPNDHTAGFFFVCHSLKYVPVSYCSKKNLLISRSSDCLNLRTQFVLHVAHLITKIQHPSFHVNLFSLTWTPFNLQWHRNINFLLRGTPNLLFHPKTGIWR